MLCTTVLKINYMSTSIFKMELFVYDTCGSTGVPFQERKLENARFSTQIKL